MRPRSQELRRLTSDLSGPALVCRSAQASAPANVTKIATTMMLISNASAGMMPSPVVSGIIRGSRPKALIPTKARRPAWESGCGQGLDLRRIEQADPAMNDLDHAVA